MRKRDLQIPQWLDEGLSFPVAVLGNGISGKAASQLIRKLGGTVVLYDEKGGNGISTTFGSQEAKGHRLIVHSPGFAEDHQWLEVARSEGCSLCTEFDLGASLWRGPLVAVTGTNGKTTLVEFLSVAFRCGGIEAYVAGNIGIPLSKLIADDFNREAISICEVSSFQAASSRRLKPDYVLWTNFAEDHLDRHRSLETYFKSKYRLFEQMRGDIFQYGESVHRYGLRFGLRLPESGLVSDHILPESLGIASTGFASLPERKNYLMARALWLRMGLEEAEIIEAAHSFRKSPHRMELVKSVDGISFWDDSKATNYHAVLGGLDRFSQPVIWIGGGKSKGCDVQPFAEGLAGNVSEAHVIGETKEALCDDLKAKGIKTHPHDTIEEATQVAFANASTGDNILLSPGFASHDMFEGYIHRGEVFKKAVNNLSSKEIRRN